MSYEYDVFLCHNSEDKPDVKRIANELRTRGLKPWLDEWELRPGFPWQRILEEEIDNIKSAVVFVGPSGIGPWQQLELEGLLRRFVERNGPVIPILLPGAPSEVELPVFLRGMTWVDLRQGVTKSGVDRLIWGITGARGPTPGEYDKSITSYAPRPAALHEVFCTTGLPDFTYVEPPIYREVENDILQPGKHVLITGASGTGKTCLLTRILNNLNLSEGKDYIFISSLDDDTDNKVADLIHQALNGEIKVPVVIDDFHVLSRKTRARLGTKMKQLSDNVFRTKQNISNFILLGIATSAQSLLYNVPDLGRRMGTYKMPLPEPADLNNLIKRGERKLTVEFMNRERIIDESSSSFLICQHLCNSICLESQVTQTKDYLTPLKYRIEDVRTKLIGQLSEQFAPFLRSFVQKSGLSRDEWLPFISIIAAISGIPNWQFTIDEITSISGDFAIAIRSIKEEIHKVICISRLNKSLNYDENTELLSIEDPLLRYYLDYFDLSDFIRSLGISEKDEKKIIGIHNDARSIYQNYLPITVSASRRKEIFVSYSHKDRKWLDSLITHLKPLARKQEFNIWVDTQIRAGLKWREEISKAIDRARVAVLLVSANFLASDFIAEDELPPLLRAAEDDGLIIIWIPAGYCLYEETLIKDFQAAIDPSVPLESLSSADLNKALVEVSIKIKEAVESPHNQQMHPTSFVGG